MKKFHATSASRVTTATSRILNKLIDALNKNDRMPKYIIFLLDKDIIGDLKSIEYGATKNLANIVNWLARQCDILIHRKKLQISEKKPGASMGRNFPVCIFTTMLRRLEMFNRESNIARACAMRPKFNEIINEAAACQNYKVMDIHSCNTLDHFDRWGELTSKGKAVMWYEIDDLMERFDDLSDHTITFNPHCRRNQLNDRQCQFNRLNSYRH